MPPEVSKISHIRDHVHSYGKSNAPARVYGGDQGRSCRPNKHSLLSGQDKNDIDLGCFYPDNNHAMALGISRLSCS